MIDTVTHEEFEALWDAKDVAQYVKASRSWVYQKAESGELPSLRVCGLLRFEPVAVRTWARNQRDGASVIPLAQRSSSVP